MPRLIERNGVMMRRLTVRAAQRASGDKVRAFFLVYVVFECSFILRVLRVVKNPELADSCLPSTLYAIPTQGSQGQRVSKRNRVYKEEVGYSTLPRRRGAVPY